MSIVQAHCVSANTLGTRRSCTLFTKDSSFGIAWPPSGEGGTFPGGTKNLEMWEDLFPTAEKVSSVRV